LNRTYNILYVAAEASPLVKVGGLGDVAGSLPRALRRSGHDARIVVPGYDIAHIDGYLTTSRGSFTVPFMGGEEEVSITQVMLADGTHIYLVGNERYFDRGTVYGEQDDLDRFTLFSRAVIELPKMLNWQPDILHCHDWHSGLAIGLLKVAHRNDPFYSSCASVYTIHNLAYQGWFDDHFAWRADIKGYLPPPGDPLRPKTYSMTGLSIYHSDTISTVSENYAREILTPEYGAGLEELLQRRQDSLIGIRNGVDYEQFDPARDPAIAANYDVYHLDRRVENKLALQRRAGLPENVVVPVLGMAGRLAHQKGIDIALEALTPLLAEADVQFVLQGTGDPTYEESLRRLESQYPSKVRALITPDLSIAQLVFAGCDIFMMPSRFEPCGLAPLIAMHYGAIPVSRRTGGLAETIQDCTKDLSSGLGFVFDNVDVEELRGALKRAMRAFQRKEKWQKLMIRAMEADFSWKNAIPKYTALYELARRKALG
jgi:starch synthase